LHRGIVLGLSLTLAAALQLVATPSASADGGLLGGLTEILTPSGDAADAPAETDETGLLGGLLDTVGEVTEPLTGDLLDPVTDTLDPVTGDLDAALTESLNETIAGLTEPLTEVTPIAPGPSTSPAGAPAETPLVGAGTILDAILEPVAPQAADTITPVTEPLQPLVADAAPLLVGESEPATPGLLPMAPALETLGPVIGALQPILEPALRLTSAVVRPVVMLVEPVASPVLRSLDRILQPVAGLLQPFTSPVVDVPPAPAPAIEPAPAPGTGEPPPPRTASTAGIPLFDQGEAPVQAQLLARAAVLMATASIQVLEMPGTQASGTNPMVAAPTRFLEGALLRAMEEPVRAAGESDSPSVLLLSSSGAGEKDSSSKFQAPFAAIPQYFVLLVAGYLLFLLTYGARSQSWLKCPVRPPI
jgi:hypothetical protein